MCGISVHISHQSHCSLDDENMTLLSARGPDHQGSFHCRSQTSGAYLSFQSSVLSLRQGLTEQPLVNIGARYPSVFCWNGEAWSLHGEDIIGNDANFLFHRLLADILPRAEHESPIDHNQSNGGHIEATSESNPVLDAAQAQVLFSVWNFFQGIRGPYSFVFYHGPTELLFYSRDCLGRRSLLSTVDQTGDLIISSVRLGQAGETTREIQADGLHHLNLRYKMDNEIPISSRETSEVSPWNSSLPLFPMNATIPAVTTPELEPDSAVIIDLHMQFHQSLSTRLLNIPPGRESLDDKNPSSVGILFSGGIDCTLLARMAHDILPPGPIDLLNVAFENPRVVQATKTSSNLSSDPYLLCPDRQTALSSLVWLKRSCPTRLWRLSCINVSHAQYLAHIPLVRTLMAPHDTEMDLSICIALFFASRGRGLLEDGTNYCSGARVLLSGLGADELFAGYSRHAIRFKNYGYEGLIEELKGEIGNIAQRNLGRDDRVLSHSGRETRFPFLDEKFVGWVTQRPVWEKCAFGRPDKDGLGPDKRALRLLAIRLGLGDVAKEKKRAIQFGARTARMEPGKTKGTARIKP